MLYYFDDTEKRLKKSHLTDGGVFMEFSSAHKIIWRENSNKISLGTRRYVVESIQENPAFSIHGHYNVADFHPGAVHSISIDSMKPFKRNIKLSELV